MLCAQTFTMDRDQFQMSSFVHVRADSQRLQHIFDKYQEQHARCRSWYRPEALSSRCKLLVSCHLSPGNKFLLFAEPLHLRESLSYRETERCFSIESQQRTVERLIDFPVPHASVPW